jgi:hypothetical protein
MLSPTFITERMLGVGRYSHGAGEWWWVCTFGSVSVDFW